MSFLRTANITWHIVAKRDVPAAADPKRTYSTFFGGGMGGAFGEPLSSPDVRGENFLFFCRFSAFSWSKFSQNFCQNHFENFRIFINFSKILISRNISPTLIETCSK